MGKKGVYEWMKEYKKVRINYAKNNKPKQKTGTPEEIIEILEEISHNPKTMKWKKITGISK